MIGAVTIKYPEGEMDAVYFGLDICNIRRVEDKLIIKLDSGGEIFLKIAPTITTEVRTCFSQASQTSPIYESDVMHIGDQIIAKIRKAIREDGYHTVDFVVNPNKEIVYWGIDYDH